MTTTPTFLSSGRPESFEAERLARLLPRGLTERVGDRAAAHEKLARQLGEARAKATALRARIAEVEADDRRAAEKAVSAGRQIPKAKLPAVEAELTEAEREVEVVTGLIAPSAKELLAAAAEFAPDVRAECDDRAEEAEDEALRLLASAADALEVAAQARSEAAWYGELIENGAAHP